MSSSIPHRKWLIAMAALVLMAPAREAHAYIDPNAAGWLFQLLFPIFAALLAVWAFLRNRAASLWRRIVGLFRRRQDTD